MKLTDRLTYAVGDIHGRADLLVRLLGQIRDDHARRPVGDARAIVVFLGDYIDRGPQSREVIDLLLDFARDPAFETRFLLGNHEDTMLSYLNGEISGAGWGEHGGGATLQSYGVPPPSSNSRTAWSELRGTFTAAVPIEHRRFLDGLELIIPVGRLLFVHAGIRPGVAIDAQRKHDLLWIRTDFLEGARDDAWLVVHGHTPRSEAYGGPGRLCLDSGGYLTGRLTAAVFDASGVVLIETHRDRPRGFPVELAG